VGLFTWYKPYAAAPFVTFDSPSAQVPLPLLVKNQSSRTLRVGIQLGMQGTFDPKKIAAIDLAFFTSQTHPRVMDAQIFQGEDCFLRARGAAFSGSQLLRFRHPDVSTLRFTWENKKSCDPAAPFDLEIQRTLEGTLGLWAHHGSVKTGPLALKITDPNPEMPIEARAAILMGRIVIPATSSRIWQAPGIFFQDLALGSRILLVCSFLLLSVLVFVFLPVQLRKRPVALLAFMLSMIVSSFFYLIYLPPFQAADEPDHFLSFASSEMQDKGFKLAESQGFDRVKFRYLETLNSYELEESKVNGWPSHVQNINSYEIRSPLAHALYSVYAKHVGSSLADLRTLGVVLLTVSLAFVLGFYSYIRLSQNAILLTIFLVAAFQPLLYFAATVSNYSFLATLSMVYAAGYVGLIAAPKKALEHPWILLGFFFVLNLMFATSVNGLPQVISFLALLFLIAFARSERTHSHIQRLYFWSVFSLGSVLILWLMPVTAQSSIIAREMFVNILQRYSLPLHTGAFAWPAVILAASGYVVEYVGIWLRSHQHFKKHLTLMTMSLSCLILFATMTYFFSQNGNMPFLSEGLAPEAASTSKVHLATYSLKAALNSLWSQLGNYPDYWISQSFWNPFGWLDTNGPENISRFLNLMTLFGLLALARTKLAKRLSYPGVLPFVIVMVSALMIAIIAYQAAALGIDVVGRYLLSAQIFTGFVALGALVNLASLRSFLAELLLIITFLCWSIAGMLTVLDRYYLALGGSL
jgi:hypothetical protein